jgi:hypothetical protein
MNVFPDYISSSCVESDFVFTVVRVISGFSVLVSGELWIFLGGDHGHRKIASPSQAGSDHPSLL